MMKINKINEMSSPELEKELSELKTELFKLRFQLAANGLENPMKIKTTNTTLIQIIVLSPAVFNLSAILVNKIIGSPHYTVPCFLATVSTLFEYNISNAPIMYFLVLTGSIIESTYPLCAADTTLF